MAFWDLFKKKTSSSHVSGTLSYIPGSTTPTQDVPISINGGELQKRLYVQPEGRPLEDHTNIPIYTGNPFRRIKAESSLL